MENREGRVDGNANGGRGGVDVAFRFCSRRVHGLAFGVRCNGKPRPPRTCEGRLSRRKGRRLLTQSTITPTKIQECLAMTSLYLGYGTASCP